MHENSNVLVFDTSFLGQKFKLVIWQIFVKIEFRSKCDFLRLFDVQNWILCTKIQIIQLFYFLKASFLARKFKLVIW